LMERFREPKRRAALRRAEKAEESQSSLQVASKNAEPAVLHRERKKNCERGGAVVRSRFRGCFRPIATKAWLAARSTCGYDRRAKGDGGRSKSATCLGFGLPLSAGSWSPSRKPSAAPTAPDDDEIDRVLITCNHCPPIAPLWAGRSFGPGVSKSFAARG
jgi:hypothetical protein